MYKAMRCWVFVAIASIWFSSSLALAEGKAIGHSDKPHGWQKEGWKGDPPSGIKNNDGWIPPGQSKQKQAKWKDGRPPGWSHGEKKGWGDAQMPPGLAKSTPPGWEKWNHKKKKEWIKELEKAEGKIESKKNNPTKERKREASLGKKLFLNQGD